jgi:hypothetical protein
MADIVTVLDFDSVLINKASIATQIVNFIVVEVLLVNTVQTSDISITLLLEIFPVESVVSSIDLKSILLCLAQ